MADAILLQVLLGLYLGVLTGIIPALIAWILAFTFKYFTGVTVPALGVVVLVAALAGISGGLMGLLDPAIAETWVSIIALLVVLMMALWAHGQGDKMGVSFPRRITLQSIREKTLSAEAIDYLGGLGQARIRVEEVLDIDGYPPLSEDTRKNIQEETWTFPADLPIAELETRLADRLMTEFNLADISVTLSTKGVATIEAAPSPAGLSRRVPTGRRAVSFTALIPTNIAAGDGITIILPHKKVRATVLGFEYKKHPASKTPVEKSETSEKSVELKEKTEEKSKSTIAEGGEGRITVTVRPTIATELLAIDSAPIIVRSQGKQREYELVTLFKKAGMLFRSLTVQDEGQLEGRTLAEAEIRDKYDVAVFAIKRGTKRIIAPDGATKLKGGDEIIISGSATSLTRFEDVINESIA